MRDATGLLVVVGAIVALTLAAAVRFDIQARRRGSKLVSGAAMAQAIKDAKRDARASRGLRHLGQGPRSRPSGRPSWDDRKG